MHEISLQRAWERHVTPDHHSVWVRWFQMPTNVVAGERVYLVADPCHLPNMWLNGDALADMECGKESCVFQNCSVDGIASFSVRRSELTAATSNGSWKFNPVSFHQIDVVCQKNLEKLA